jgi:NADH-ubiquinone oxidoreductase chain 4
VCLLLAGYQAKSLHALWLGILVSNELIHYAAFTAGSLLGFFIAYEAVLIPLQILIAYWGSGVKRLRASLLFFLFTYASSAPMLISVIYLTSFYTPSSFTRAGSFFVACCSLQENMGLWLTFGLSFAAKTPLFPFFVWLLFAHAEAPVEGSMLLAGVVLKLATYGVVSVLLGILWEGTIAAIPFGLAAAAFTLVMASISLVQQIDLKAFVALSSVAHMGNGTLGLLSLTEEGAGGALLIGLSHGLVSPCLFLIVGGFLYGGLTTRLIYAYRGLMVLVPVLAALMISHLLANMAVPLSPNWVSELLILAGLAHGTMVLCFLSALNILASAVYTL